MIFTSRKRQDRAWRRRHREFVYLDEVSVTSLIAARDGSIAESISDTLTRATEAESKTTVGLPSKIVKLGAESRVRTSDTSSRQVVRRTVIQSTFRELRSGGVKDIHLIGDSRPRRASNLPTITTADELRRFARRLRKSGALLPLSEIQRGDVIELEVTLQADKTYRFVSAISSIIEIVKGREVVFGMDDVMYEQIVPVVEIIDRLLVGLVPVRGISTKYRALSIDGEEYIVQKSILAADGEVANASLPLEVVGVTEFGSYWKDLRRILFSETAYTAYMRVESPTLRQDWNPVKLADLLRFVSLDINALIKELPDDLSKAGNYAEADLHQNVELIELFTYFGKLLTDAMGIEKDNGDLQDLAERAVATLDVGIEDVDSRRRAFESIVDAVRLSAGEDPDRELIRRLRDDTYDKFVGSGKATRKSLDSPRDHRDAVGRKLEVEFVAIYW